MKIALLLTFFVVGIFSETPPTIVHLTFEEFKELHGKVYDSPQIEEKRRKTYEDAMAKATEHNEKQKQINGTQWEGAYPWSDLTEEQLKKLQAIAKYLVDQIHGEEFHGDKPHLGMAWDAFKKTHPNVVKDIPEEDGSIRFRKAVIKLSEDILFKDKDVTEITNAADVVKHWFMMQENNLVSNII